VQTSLLNYTQNILDVVWPAQQKGQIENNNVPVLTDVQADILSFEPITEGQKVLQAETLGAFNQVINARRLRIDAVGTGLSPMMWGVIWIGAMITILVGYFFYIEDLRLI
jgi:hypothetical protein